MKPSKIIRAAAYVAAGLAIIILHKALVAYAGYVVGCIVVLYALEELIRCALNKSLFKEDGSLFEDIVEIIIGVLLILTASDIIKVCLIWGVWSIIRESREMTGAIRRILKRRPGIINVAESVVVIVMSAMMILEPGEHHATVHMFLLGIELILEIVFEAVEFIYERKLAEREEKQAAKENLLSAIDGRAEEVAAAENDQR